MVSNGRGIGIVSAIQQVVEGPLVLLFALLTQLGDVWFLFLLASVLYVATEHISQLQITRHQGAFVLALALLYTVLITGLKGLVAFPRPPGAGEPPVIHWLPELLSAVVTSITTADGYGFPSGHALGSTMVFGGIAVVGKYGTRRTRGVTVGGIIALVSVSRLVLGVHYVIDVLAGVAIGTVALCITYWLTDRGTVPERVFISAVVLGGAGLLIDHTFEQVAAFGGGVGGWLAWRYVVETERGPAASPRALSLSLTMIGIAGCLFGLIYLREPSPVVTFLGSAIAIGTVVGTQEIGDQVSHRMER
jgi:membrane-associated phospholipid phosphatase